MERRRITEHISNLIRSARKSGKSLRQIGRELNFSQATIGRHIQQLRENGAFSMEYMESEEVPAETALETGTEAVESVKQFN